MFVYFQHRYLVFGTTFRPLLVTGFKAWLFVFLSFMLAANQESLISLAFMTKHKIVGDAKQSGKMSLISSSN